MHNMERSMADAMQLDRVRQLQAAWTASALPEVQGIELAGRTAPGFDLNGDYFECFPLSGRRAGLMIADVTGKGLPAAVVQAMVRTLVHAYEGFRDSPADLLTAMNRQLYRDLPPEIFVTAAYCVVDLDTWEMRFARAGHEPIMRLTRVGAWSVHEPEGMAMGLDEGGLFRRNLEEATLEIEPGDMFLLVTDGVAEAESGTGEAFGYTRLEHVVRSAPPDTRADQLVDRVWKAVEAHMAGGEAADDMTVLVARSAE